jgi:hypothetical protein
VKYPAQLYDGNRKLKSVSKSIKVGSPDPNGQYKVFGEQKQTSSSGLNLLGDAVRGVVTAK